MRYINRVTLLGRAGKDAECRTLNSGKLMATFSLATSQGYKDASGQWQEKTEWSNIKAFGKPAETARDQVRKGGVVLVDGRLETETWDDKQTGKKQYKTVILVDVLVPLDAKKQEQPPPQQQGGFRDDSPITDADIPF